VFDIEESGFLVKKELTIDQLEKEKEVEVPKIETTDNALQDEPHSQTTSSPSPDPIPTPPIPEPKITKFHFIANLDSLRTTRDVNKIVEEILKNLPDGSDLNVELSVDATVIEGFKKEEINIINQKCKDLNIENIEFY